MRKSAQYQLSKYYLMIPIEGGSRQSDYIREVKFAEVCLREYVGCRLTNACPVTACENTSISQYTHRSMLLIG